MTRKIENGSLVKIKDEYGVQRDALATAVWSSTGAEYDDEKPLSLAINVVYVSTDPRRTDQYGQQIERLCSVMHRSTSGDCPGRYWWQE